MGWAGCFPKTFLSKLSLGVERSLHVSLSHSPWGPYPSRIGGALAKNGPCKHSVSRGWGVAGSSGSGIKTRHLPLSPRSGGSGGGKVRGWAASPSAHLLPFTSGCLAPLGAWHLRARKRCLWREGVLI